MSRWLRFSSFPLIALAACSAALAGPADRDGDGIRDDHEKILGTDASVADVFQVVKQDGVESDEIRAREGYDPTKDFTTIEFAHVGGDRYLWRVTFPVEPRLEDTVFHLYVDADADEATGRKGSAGAASTGTEYMLSVVAGRGTSTYYDAEGNRTSGPMVTFVVDRNSLIVSADVELGRDAGEIRYDLYVLCHTTTESGKPVRMSDSTGKSPVEGIPVVHRKKIMRPRDYTENFRVAATFGPEAIRKTLGAAGSLAVPHDRLELDGFIVDLFNTRRWPHVRVEGAQGRVSTLAPKAGRFHVGFMMYDDSSDERIVLSIENEMRGVAVANKNNNRTWLYWLTEPCDFQGGERVELAAAGPSGRHGIVNILFLSEPPEPRKIGCKVENLTSAVHVGRAGRVTVSWTTTWPCPTRFEYGTDTKYGRSVETEGNCLVHRVVLERLDPQHSFHGRAIGTAPDGTKHKSSDFVFQAAPPAAPPTRQRVHSIPLSIGNPHAFPVRAWPVTGGIPFPEGVLGSPDHVRLMSNDKEIPAQIGLTARWPDESVKWILVSLSADVAAESKTEYRLEFGSRIRRKAIAEGVSTTEDAQGIAIDTGALRFRIDSRGNLREFSSPDGASLTTPDAACRSVAVDAEGTRYETGLDEARLEVEESGPLRSVVKVTSHLAAASGKKLMRIEKRIETYRDAPFVRLHHTFTVDTAETFTRVKELSYQIPLAASDRSWLVPLVDGEPLMLDASTPTVRQRFDHELVLATTDGPITGQITGAILDDREDGCAVAVRDFWQNYPKAFSLHADGLHVDLCPPIVAGLYDKFPFEKEGHQLYYYLLDGQYRLKRGTSKTHELFLSFEPAARRAESCALFQRPLLLTVSPKWVCDSKAFYSVAARDTGRFQLYESAIDKNLVAYAERQRRQHDFGMLNYGDWYGERGSNWGNVEYDTQHAFFLEYIRSGNPAAFFLGAATELHNRDIDTVHWSENPDEVGGVYVHQMCHVGQYYDKGVPGTLGFPRGGYTVSHAWVEGHFDHYFLTGDRRSYETGCEVADYFIRKELGRPYDFSSTRTPGWHLIMLVAAYAATDDPYYLNAAKVIVEYVLETQDVEPRPLPEYQAEGRQPYQLGGWSRMMVPGHCQCEPRHRGNAGFMIAVLLSGLKYYHDVTGDQRVKEAIIRGAHYLVDENYSDEVQGFRYTSCPNTGYRPGASPLMVEGIARAYLWTRDDRFRRVLAEALPHSAGGSSYGKGFSMYYRMAPRVLADMAAAGVTFNEPVPPAK